MGNKTDETIFIENIIFRKTNVDLERINEPYKGMKYSVRSTLEADERKPNGNLGKVDCKAEVWREGKFIGDINYEIKTSKTDLCSKYGKNCGGVLNYIIVPERLIMYAVSKMREDDDFRKQFGLIGVTPQGKMEIVMDAIKTIKGIKYDDDNYFIGGIVDVSNHIIHNDFGR